MESNIGDLIIFNIKLQRFHRFALSRVVVIALGGIGGDTGQAWYNPVAEARDSASI
jgi:hypothetical protein